jgi:predicted SnoaL-like aldol condensation-catalyzing enzyme
MAETNIEKVLAVLEAIRAQDAARATQYVGGRFVQHDPYITPGAEGLRQYINSSAPEQLNFTVVRTFQDDPYVAIGVSTSTRTA